MKTLRITVLPKANQFIRRKGSAVKWQVWFVDVDSLSLAHHKTGAGRRITHFQYAKNWEIVA